MAYRVAYLNELSDLPAWDHPRGDELVYVDAADDLVEGSACEPFHMSPLYIGFTAAVRAVSGTGPVTWRAVQTLLGLLTAMLLGGVARRRYGEWAGYGAAGLYLFSATAIFYESNVAVATLTSTLLVVVLYCTQRWLDALIDSNPAPQRWLWWLLASAAVGLAVTARPNALFLLFPLTLAPWLVRPKAVSTSTGVSSESAAPSSSSSPSRSTSPVPSRLLHTLAALLTAMAVTAPVTLYNHHCSGEVIWITDTGGTNLFIGNHRGATGAFAVPERVPGAHDLRHQEAAFALVAEQETGRSLSRSEVDQYWVDQTLEEISADPGQWLGLMGLKLALIFNGRELSNNRSYPFRDELMTSLGPWLVRIGYLLPLAVIGLFGWLARPRKELFPLGFTLAYVAALALVFVIGRYRHVLLPLFVLAAVYGAKMMWDLWRARSRTWFLAGILVAVVAAIQLNTVILETSRAAEAYKHAYALHIRGDLDDAEHWYLEAIDEEPEHLSSLKNLAILFTDSNRVAEAIERWNQLLRAADRVGDEGRAAEAQYFLHQLSP